MQHMPPRPATAVNTIARECLAKRVRRLARVVTRIYDDALRPHGVTAGQLNLLVGIAFAGAVRPVDLARALDMDKSTLSRNLQRLEEQRWIRVADGDDARSRTLTITERGERVVQDAYPAWRAAQKQIVDTVGEPLVHALMQTE